MTEDLFKEVDEDIRAEKLHYLMRRYAKFIVLACIVILIAIGAWQFQQWQQRKAFLNASASYLQIMQQVDPMSKQNIDDKTTHEAVGRLSQLSKHAPQSIRVLSQLKQASLLVDQGKIKEASSIWDAIRFDKTASSDFRSLANILWVENNIDTAKTKELHSRINELLSEKTPWYAMAKECEGLLDLKSGKLIEAKQVFGQLSIDPNVSPGIKQRASVMLQIMANNKKG